MEKKQPASVYNKGRLFPSLSDYLKGGAYKIPPLFHSLLIPRLITDIFLVSRRLKTFTGT